MNTSDYIKSSNDEWQKRRRKVKDINRFIQPMKKKVETALEAGDEEDEDY